MLLQTVVNRLVQEPHAVINLSLALLLVTMAWYLIVRVHGPLTSFPGEFASALAATSMHLLTFVNPLISPRLSSCCQ